MGTLVAKKYPTKLFLKAADHTYVECGNGGKGWSCWGGKTGGTAFNSGTGSTKRADAIAEPNERAGITCYLINGVCHQAANRILFPAGILVSAARGYSVSSALFGPYGKTGFWPCHAPFDQHAGVSGDLPECSAAKNPLKSLKSVKKPPVPASRKNEDKYSRLVMRSYAKFEPLSASVLDHMKFQADVFDHQIKFCLGEDLGDKAKALRMAKETADMDHQYLANAFRRKEMSPAQFIKAFNKMTIRFQNDVATAVNKVQYKKLLGVDRDESIVLADPEIIASLYGEATVKAVYGDL